MTGRRIAAAVLALSVAAGITATVTAPAQAATRVTSQTVVTKGAGLNLAPGRNHKGPMWAGQYVDSTGNRGWCVDYLLGLSTAPFTVRVARDSFPSDEATARAIAITTRYASTRDNRAAAQVQVALASLIAAEPGHMKTADQRGRATKLAADLAGYVAQVGRDAVAKMLADSKSHAPYKLAVVAPKTAPGQPAAVTVTVRDSRGTAVKVPVTLTYVGASGPAKGTTGTVRVVPSALSYTVAARADVTSSTRALLSVPGTGRQVLLGAGVLEQVTGSACATVCPVKAVVSIDAECLDNGKHAVTVTFAVEDVPGIYRGWLVIGGVRSDVEVAAGESRPVLGRIADGQAITVGFTILDDTGRVLVTRTLYVSAGV